VLFSFSFCVAAKSGRSSSWVSVPVLASASRWCRPLCSGVAGFFPPWSRRPVLVTAPKIRRLRSLFVNACVCVSESLFFFSARVFTVVACVRESVRVREFVVPLDLRSLVSFFVVSLPDLKVLLVLCSHLWCSRAVPPCCFGHDERIRSTVLA
jgi:hypothetical protein